MYLGDERGYQWGFRSRRGGVCVGYSRGIKRRKVLGEWLSKE